MYGFLALVLSAIAARRIVGVTAGTLAAVCFGTPLVFYMYVAPGFSHANSAFAVAAFVVAWLHVRRDWSAGGVAALGALAALMGMVREQDLFIAIGPAIDYVVKMGRAVRSSGSFARRVLWKAALGVAAVAVFFLPQAIAYLTLYGHLGPSPDVQQKMTWTAPNAWRVLVSPDNGWFFWTPLALPALIGLVALACGYGRREQRRRAGERSRTSLDWRHLPCHAGITDLRLRQPRYVGRRRLVRTTPARGTHDIPRHRPRARCCR